MEEREREEGKSGGKKVETGGQYKLDHRYIFFSKILSWLVISIFMNKILFLLLNRIYKCKCCPTVTLHMYCMFQLYWYLIKWRKTHTHTQIYIYINIKITHWTIW